MSWFEFGRRLAHAFNMPEDLVEAAPSAGFGWLAPRPPYSALVSQRGVLLPPVPDAVEARAWSDPAALKKRSKAAP